MPRTQTAMPLHPAQCCRTPELHSVRGVVIRPARRKCPPPGGASLAPGAPSGAAVARRSRRPSPRLRRRCPPVAAMTPPDPPPRAATTGFERRGSTGFSPRFGMSVTARRRAGDESPRVLGASDPGGREGPGEGASLGTGHDAGDGPAAGDERERRGSAKGLPGSASGTPTTYLNARLRSQLSAVWSQRGWSWGRPAFLQGVLKGDPEARARFQGRLLLLAVAFLWGSYGVIARDVFLLPHPPPVSIFTFFRKLVAASSFFLIEAFSFGASDAAASPESRQLKQAAAKDVMQAKDEIALDLEKNGAADGDRAALLRSLSAAGRSSSDAQWATSPNVRDFFGGGQRRLRRVVSPARWKLPPLFLPALELGLWQFLGTAFQALGLEHTSATRAGFVVQTTNVLVPIISFLSGDSILPTTWLAALLAMAGVVTMGLASEDGGDATQAAAVVESQAGLGLAQAASMGQGDATSHPLPLLQEAQRRMLALAHPDVQAAQAAPIPGALGDLAGTTAETQGAVPSTALALASVGDGAVLGDVEVLCGALFYSLATVRLSRFLRQHKPYELSAATMVSAAFFAGGWALYEVAAAEASGKGALSLFEGWVDQPGVWGSIFTSAIASGTLASLAQSYGQRVVPPAQAQVLYSLQPLFSAGLAAIILHESLPPIGWIGASLVIMASLISA